MATQVTVNAGQGSTQVTAITGEGSTSYKVEAGSRGPTGATGATGATGPNSITTSTSSNLTGFIAANGTAVSGATAGATAATANTLALRDATGGSNFAAVGASSVTSSGAISTTGINGSISTSGYDAIITTVGENGYISTSGATASISTSGAEATIGTIGSDASIYTDGANASIYTQGLDATITTSGAGASIFTQGANASIYTLGLDAIISTSGADASILTQGVNAYIQSRSTFKLYGGTYTTTLSHAATADRAIAFPDKAGTVAMIDAETHTGAHAFSSTTRPTSAGTGTPAATSLMTRDDVAAHAYFSRRLFGNCSGTTGGGGSGATSRRPAANGLIDGDISTSATLGAFYKINIVSGSGSSSLMGVAASGSVNLSAKWSMFFRVALQMGTNSHFYLCIGADGASGVPSSGTSVGMEITSATVARLFRCNAGAAVYSSNATISGITTSTSTTDLFFWVDNDGTGNLSLFFAPKLFSAAMPAKPATAIATLAGVASGFTGSDVAMYLRATAASPSVFTSLIMRDVVFTEY